jgi:hypothetical protein
MVQQHTHPFPKDSTEPRNFLPTNKHPSERIGAAKRRRDGSAPALRRELLVGAYYYDVS